MKVYILFSILLFSIISCSQKDNVQGSNQIIKIDINESQILDLSNLCSKIELIPLETSKESIISDVGKICESTEYYYVLDSRQHVLFKFSKDGQFVCSTKRIQGRGPGEYTSLTDFEINPLTGNIEMLDARNLKIQILDTDLKFLSSISLDNELLPLSRFKIISNDTYVFPRTDTNEKNVLVFYSIKRNKIIKKIELPDTGSKLVTTAGNPFYTFNGQINYSTKNYSNVLYSIDTTALDVIEAVKIDFGQNNINLDNFLKIETIESHDSFTEGPGKESAYLTDIFENEKNYIIKFDCQKKFFVSKYDKTTHQVSTLYKEFGSKGQLAPPSLVSNNQIICLSEPMYLKYYLQENLMDDNSKVLFSHVNENDNPILIKYYLK